MSNSKIDISKRIIIGIQYLQAEASNHGAHDIAQLLKECVRDICSNLEGTPELMSEPSIVTDSDLLTAVNFLNKFASIRDDNIRNEIVAEIELAQKILN